MRMLLSQFFYLMRIKIRKLNSMLKNGIIHKGAIYVKIRANKKILTITVILLTAITAAIVLTAFAKGDNAAKTMEAYKSKWEKQDYKGMYSMLSSNTKEKVTEQQFVERYTAIYKDIGAKNISIKLNNGNKIKAGKKESLDIPFSLTMDTAAGKLKIADYEAALIKEKENNKKVWKIGWDEKMIFPGMEPDDKVRMNISKAKRGEIYDRNEKALAINTQVYNVGIHPSKFIKNKDMNIVQLAKVLDIDTSVIENKLKVSTNPEQFVPIVNVSSLERDKVLEAIKIDGVTNLKPEGRVYPGGEAFGSLIGYIGEITAEELEKMKDQGYSVGSLIGKAGLEQVYEKRLKGENGIEIYISKIKDGKQVQKVTLAKKEPKNGENIKLFVDFDLQKKIYDEMNKDGGACAAVNPKTGEVMALVSSPSYDSNARTCYTTNTQRALWKNSSKDPFQNRFKNVYSPGSTFKLLTAAVGLNQGKIKADEAINIQGNQWQADKSWGNYKITRVTDPGKPVNLKDAFVYSDNIYFAKAALGIGKDDFIRGCNSFGLGEALPIDYPIVKSQLSNDNNIKNDEMLADSGYGQGEVLMSPLHVALMYSAAVNEGKIMAPMLENKNNTTPKLWKDNVIGKDNIKYLVDGLTAVVEDPSGTGHAAKTKGVVLAGKTGTPELKKSGDDKNAEENGWFVCMNTDNPKLVVSMIIENVKTRGESHYVVPKVKNIMEYYLIQRGGQ